MRAADITDGPADAEDLSCPHHTLGGSVMKLSFPCSDLKKIHLSRLLILNWPKIPTQAG